MLLALPVQFSAELVAAAICCSLALLYIDAVALPRRPINIAYVRTVLPCSLDSLDSSSLLGGQGSRRRRRRALRPEPVADPHDASFKPRTLKLPALPSS